MMNLLSSDKITVFQDASIQRKNDQAKWYIAHCRNHTGYTITAENILRALDAPLGVYFATKYLGA